jgi:tRNA pseudouridine32 synthase / 23S rRNA pseudouridine746 synthase
MCKVFWSTRRQCKLVLHHRLDLDTTGVLVFGKDPAYNKQLTDMFRDREVEKTYWAVVEGRWLAEWSLVETYILKIRGRWTNIPKNKGGQFARTRFSLKATNASKSWLECKPETGRTHQIRLHCLEKAHPILGRSKLWSG